MTAPLPVGDPTSRLLYGDFVRKLSQRLERELADIEVHHNYEYGDEFEINLCKVLRRVLPKKFGCCRGYVVNRDGEEVGDDVIIYDQNDFPTLRGLGDEREGALERIPIEAVYAYIEAKHTLDLDGSGPSSFEGACRQAAAVKALCLQREFLELNDFNANMRAAAIVPQPYGWPPVRNPAFAGVISRRIKFKTADNVLTNPQKLHDALFGIGPNQLHLPDFIVAGSDRVVLPAVPFENDPNQWWVDSPFFHPNLSKYFTKEAEGIAFGIGMVSILSAIHWMQLGRLPWLGILSDAAGIPRHEE